MQNQSTRYALMVWPALLLAPSIALIHLSIAYSLVTPSCATQQTVALEAVAAVAFAISLVTTLLAWRCWSWLAAAAADRMPSATASDDVDARSWPRFLALVATLVGALATLVNAAMWLPMWVLSPCT